MTDPKCPWSDLPNADHISRVLHHSNQHPERWRAARDAAWDAARDAVSSEAWDAAGDAARDAVSGEVWDAAWDAAGDAAGDAVAALIAFDYCGEFLSRSPDDLRAHYRLINDPAAVLLLPAVIALKDC